MAPVHQQTHSIASESFPQPTASVDVATADLDAFGYCMVADVLGEDEVQALRTRLRDQRTAEEQLGIAYHGADNKQIVKFLVNKGRVFRDLLSKRSIRRLIEHVLGPRYNLSSFHGHIAHPGQRRAFHTDQFWMPPPTNVQKETLIRPGEVTRSGHRGHHRGPRDQPVDDVGSQQIAPAFVCNAMWMLDDFTEANGATLVVPGSHLSGRQPDHALDEQADWVAAVAPAGTVLVFEGRVWHSTGSNVSGEERVGLTTNFCAPQMRQQENFLLGTRPEVLEAASEDLLELIGFKPWEGYGSYESQTGFLDRTQYALGELMPGSNH